MSSPRAPGSRAQVFFAFGVSGREELPSGVLVHLLTDLGMSQPGARSQLRRMEQAGALASRHEGRHTHYRPSGASRTSFTRLRHRNVAEATGWDGSFHALFYSVPEQARAFRDELRRHARALGYGALRHGVLIHTSDEHDTLRSEVGETPHGTTLFVGVLTMSAAEAREAARQAWELDERAADYEARLDRLRRGAAGAPAARPNAASLRTFRDLALPVLGSLLGGPRLPKVLLPDSWPEPELVAALEEVHQAFAPSLDAYVASLPEWVRSVARGPCPPGSR